MVVARLGEGIKALARAWNVEVTDEVDARIADFLCLLLKWNKVINLTGAGSFEDLAEEHLPDSLALCRFVPAGSRLVDIGSGGGLPALPFAISRPDCTVTMVEPRGRRVAFLRTAVREIGGKNVEVVQGRLECALGGGYDIAVSRATFPPEAWLEQAQGLVGGGGRVVAFGAGPLGPSSSWALGDSVSYKTARGVARWVGFFVPRGT